MSYWIHCCYCSYNNSFRCICTFIEKTTKLFCFRVCTFIEKTNSRNLYYNYMIVLSEYFITYSFERLIKNLSCNRINETKAKKYIQKSVSTSVCNYTCFTRILFHIVFMWFCTNCKFSSNYDDQIIHISETCCTLHFYDLYEWKIVVEKSINIIDVFVERILIKW